MAAWELTEGRQAVVWRRRVRATTQVIGKTLNRRSDPHELVNDARLAAGGHCGHTRRDVT
jgi:hypothetical protein